MASGIQAMNTLKKSPTGQKLLAEAQKRGVKIQFAENNGDRVNGQYNPNNNTITVEKNNIETMVETLAHELVHAVTPENGNSKNEEFMAFKIGEQVAEEAGVNFNKHHDDFWKNHVASSYGNLKQDNGIMAALGNLDKAASANYTGFNNAPQAANAGNGGNNGTDVYNIAKQAAQGVPLAAAQANPYNAAANAAQQAAPQIQNPMMGGMQGQDMMQQLMAFIMQFIMQLFMGQMMNMMKDQTNNQDNPFNNNNNQQQPGNNLLTNNNLAQQSPQSPSNGQNKFFIMTSFTA
jgi:hypothetical protein